MSRRPIDEPLIGETMLANLAKYKKVVAAILAQLPAPVVLGILAAVGVHVPAGIVAAILAAVAAIVTPVAVGVVKNTL
ncbi:MAG: hypothetical protein JWQ81_1662 [Amycolatopsis sp.]|jgi:hypothetical protein|nr:hypothetical protein [Amycolatopsis sp.]